MKLSDSIRRTEGQNDEPEVDSRQTDKKDTVPASKTSKSASPSDGISAHRAEIKQDKTLAREFGVRPETIKHLNTDQKDYASFLAVNFKYWTNEKDNGSLTVEQIDKSLKNPELPWISKQELRTIKSYMETNHLKSVDLKDLISLVKNQTDASKFADLNHEDNSAHWNKDNDWQIQSQLPEIVKQWGTLDPKGEKALTLTGIQTALNSGKLDPMQTAILSGFMAMISEAKAAGEVIPQYFSLNELDKLTDQVYTKTTNGFTTKLSSFTTAVDRQLQAQMNAALLPYFGQDGRLTLAQITALLANPKLPPETAAALGSVAQAMQSNHWGYISEKNLPEIEKSATGNHIYQHNLAVIRQAPSLWGPGHDGPVLTDVQQGSLGDCYFVSSVEAVARDNPAAIEKMITPDGTNSAGAYVYQVKFPGYESPFTVTLTKAQIASIGDNVSKNGIWLYVLVAAYSQIRNDGEPSTKGPDWWNMSGGNSYIALSVLTGRTYEQEHLQGKNAVSSDELRSILEQSLAGNVPMGISTSDHCLSIVGFNPKTGIVTIDNPWGDDGSYTFPDGTIVEMKNGIFTMTLAQVKANFATIDFAARLGNQKEQFDRARTERISEPGPQR